VASQSRFERARRVFSRLDAALKAKGL
jgi:hypothetical protein